MVRWLGIGVVGGLLVWLALGLEAGRAVYFAIAGFHGLLELAGLAVCGGHYPPRRLRRAARRPEVWPG